MAKVFRMPGKQQPVGFQQGHKALEDLLLSYFIEINHYVTAENCVKWPGNVVVRIEQVQRGEIHVVRQLVTHPYQPLVRAGSAHEIALQLLLRERFQLLHAINTVLRFFQYFGVNIAGKHLPATRRGAQGIGQSNGDGVRLFPRRRGGAPDPIFPLPTRSMLRQRREMVRLAEERSQVGGQRIDKRLPLGAVSVGLQQAEIVTKIIQIQCPQASNQTVVNHVTLVIRQHDPGALVDQLTDPTKLRVGKRQALRQLAQ